jgi:apolipoprotein D and lipocalin family protein
LTAPYYYGAQNQIEENKMTRFLVSTFTIVILLAASKGWPAELQEPKTVPFVDLKQYAGTWYEIARYPNRFQKNCVSDVRATYSMVTDGKLSVLNQCVQANGKMKTAKGRGKVVDRTGNAKLKVTFFWPFYGDYWILDLDPNYTFAVVGEQDRKYLWILSRTPEIDSNLYNQILERITNQGYDTSKLIQTSHGVRSDG